LRAITEIGGHLKSLNIEDVEYKLLLCAYIDITYILV